MKRKDTNEGAIVQGVSGYTGRRDVTNICNSKVDDSQVPAHHLVICNIIETLAVMEKIAIFCLLLIGIGCYQNQGDEKDAFAGLWKLHIIETQDSLTHQWVQSEWMRDGISYLHYDGVESMSIHFTPKGFQHTNPENIPIDSLPIAELKMLATDYWYLGKYRIHPDKSIVEHRRIIHSDPNEWGKKVQRSYRLLGDTLELSAKEFGLRLKWIREKEN